MNLTKREIDNFPIGTKIYGESGEYLKIKGNTWQKKHEFRNFADQEMYLYKNTFSEILIPNYEPYNPNYTFEKLHNDPVGTKITFKNGRTAYKVNKNEYKYDGGSEGFVEEDIIKVEIPTGYETIYEREIEDE